MRHAMPDDVRLLLDHQAPGGAYVASPSFSQYPFAWLRDGAFIGHALDRVGERASAAAFHAWVARAVMRQDDDVRTLIEARAVGVAADHDRMLPARFGLDGRPDAGGWPDFQLDGYGQWLWSLAEHARGAPLADGVRDAAALVADYLSAFWDEPCYDAWEEGRTQHHTSTLASVAAGLRAASELLGASYAAAADAARRFLVTRCVVDGCFVKAVGNPAVDASLVWIATPLGLVDDADPVFTRTLAAIERDLWRPDGLLRYRADTFYGGGAWLLLTAGLAWHHARAGRAERAVALLAVVERHRAADGGLPEQVPTQGTDPWFLDYWTRRWGPSASPLLWSHAMVVLARSELAGPEETVQDRLRSRST